MKNPFVLIVSEAIWSAPYVRSIVNVEHPAHITIITSVHIVHNVHNVHFFISILLFYPIKYLRAPFGALVGMGAFRD